MCPCGRSPRSLRDLVMICLPTLFSLFFSFRPSTPYGFSLSPISGNCFTPSLELTLARGNWVYGRALLPSFFSCLASFFPSACLKDASLTSFSGPPSQMNLDCVRAISLYVDNGVWPASIIFCLFVAFLPIRNTRGSPLVTRIYARHNCVDFSDSLPLIDAF